MPKIILTKEQRIKEKNAKANNEIKKQLELIVHYLGMSPADVAVALGFKSQGTYYNRLKNPQNLTIEEISNIKNNFNVDITPLLLGD